MTYKKTNTFANNLTDYMVSHLISESPEIKKVIGIYPGRFQPAGVHHYKTYKWLDGKFNKAYVATSDKTDATKSPLNFKEKKMVWKKHGVRNVTKVKNPYVCEEILKKNDPKTSPKVSATNLTFDTLACAPLLWPNNVTPLVGIYPKNLPCASSANERTSMFNTVDDAE